jgi:hypothetical protein
MIYDFGYATKFKKKSKKKALLDYMRVIYAFMNSDYGWGEYSDLPSTQINAEMGFVKNELEIEFNDGKKDNIIEDLILNKIILKFENLKIFTKNKPDNVINKIPYIIG